MQITITRRAGRWRGRGRPKTDIPEQVMEALNATYKTGNIGVISRDDPDAQATLRLLKLGAESLGKIIRQQCDDVEYRFEMVDPRK